MARDRSIKQGNLREHIAHLAARIMAEDGIDDFGHAKRKAARLAGAQDARAMPDNSEIERALTTYRAIYHNDQHTARLAQLRIEALNMMRWLCRFSPHLVGPVLSGIAGKYSGIDLHLFADSSKDFEVYLLNQDVRFRASQVRIYVNDVERLTPAYSFEHGKSEFRVIVLDSRDKRHSVKTSPGGRTLERASTSMVEMLVEGA
jgi:hypothetical protein